MALSTEEVTVETTATLLSAGDPDGHTVTVKPADAADGDSVFLGASDVTASTGVPMGAGISFDLEGGAELYGIVASGTVAVRVLRHRL
jgi:hypothetical protein